jgi:hypothetical protein
MEGRPENNTMAAYAAPHKSRECGHEWRRADRGEQAIEHLRVGRPQEEAN